MNNCVRRGPSLLGRFGDWKSELDLKLTSHQRSKDVDRKVAPSFASSCFPMQLVTQHTIQDSPCTSSDSYTASADKRYRYFLLLCSRSLIVTCRKQKWRKTRRHHLRCNVTLGVSLRRTVLGSVKYPGSKGQGILCSTPGNIARFGESRETSLNMRMLPLDFPAYLS